MAKDKNKKEKKEEELPELFFVFSERGEFLADVANHAVMVKKGDEHDDILEFVGGLGRVQSMKFNSIVKDIDVDDVTKLFEEKGYIVIKAKEQDFMEIERELDKILTIKGGEHEKYKGK